ncbi:DUF3558 family protein [Streptomyces sp. NBC_00467]|uniref:DUF3558 family protein n=1 Tax=Streptomyces sp. NBC_00467 TaxID=2975752 RepID=UPI002E19CAA3
MHRSASRLTRILACAAVPVMLVVAGCSSDSDGKKESGADKPAAASSQDSADAPKPQNIEPAKFAKLPDACDAITAKTIETLVPETKTKNGTAGKTSDTTTRGSCSWNGLEDKGVKGSQYRWLDVSFLRYESESSLGVSGQKRAEDNYAKEVAKAQAAQGAKNLRTSPAAGVGEDAKAIGYELKKTDEDFTYATIVTRTDNVVITLNYNGTGYAGAKPPAASDLMKGAITAAKQAVASVTAANK